MPSGPDNPYGNGFRAVETPLETVHAAQRIANRIAAGTGHHIGGRAL